MSKNMKLDAVLIFILGMVLCLFGMNQQEIIGFDTRFYLFALEMWRHGFTWFPTTYHVPYPDYPVTSTALIYLTAKLFGGLNKFVALMPSAIATSITLMTTYLLGVTQSRRWGWFAVGFLLFTNGFLMAARSMSLDAFVTAFTMLSFYVAYSAQSRQKKMPLVTLLILFALSFAIRGPIGLIIPTGVVCVFYLLEKEIRKFFLLGFSAVFVLIACGGILLSLAYHVGGTAFMQYVLNMEVFGRMQEIRTPPRLFYFSESLGAYAVTYPLAILIVLGLLSQLKKLQLPREMKFIQHLLGWALVILLGLSVAADKKIRYILPMAPALALVCAYLFAAQLPNCYLRGLKKIVSVIFKLLPLLALCFVWMLSRRHLELNYVVLVASLACAQLLIVLFWRKEWTFFLAVFSAVICYVLVVEKINLNANQTQRFVAQIETLRLQQQAPLVFYREGTDGTVIKYLVNMPEETMPIFVDRANQIPRGAFVITSEENFQTLDEYPLRVIARGRIGHDRYVISKYVPRP